MRRVGTFILGRPRPLSTDRRAKSAVPTYTLICEEPDCPMRTTLGTRRLRNATMRGKNTQQLSDRGRNYRVLDIRADIARVMSPTISPPISPSAAAGIPISNTAAHAVGG